VNWVIHETSGDPHAVILGNLTSNHFKPYIGLASDGGLAFDPVIAKPSLPSGTSVITGTLKPNLSSGILYGSSVAYPSTPPSRYSLTFMVPGLYAVLDPFGGGRGTPEVRVIP
jgi:hypothetical protein